ncbi:AzlD domain-containing protein [Streptococcus massiliensis]|uniref:Branched-chain amino acid transport protein n=1 Tax=Streptococcus massiliensis TaxID=313439 RepID=A0A380KX98_9STRE|nr:AzlD domain-containing protein [Streptococcus massiliensis]SUN76572.1 branched-chain amino acid transport protein [Streptococcus massiliensis]
MINGYILGVIIACALVTWIPRVLPFILVKYKGLPPKVERFLQYLPVSIIFALILSGITRPQVGHLPAFKVLDLLALLPTTYVAFRYRNLVGTVLFGVFLIAFLRFIF